MNRMPNARAAPSAAAASAAAPAAASQARSSGPAALGRSLRSAARVGGNGVQASVQLHRTLLFVVTSRTTAVRMMQCLTLNFVIFLGSIAVFELVVLRSLGFLADLLSSSLPFLPLVGSLPTAESGGDISIRGVGGDAPVADDRGPEQGSLEAIVPLVEAVTSKVFTIAWLLPMYAISFILNTIWYVDIAEQVYKQEYGHVQAIGSIAVIIRDEVYRFMLMIWMSSQIYLLYIIVPYIGTPIALIQTSWLYAFYCYDYKWTLQGWPLEQRLLVFEQHWVYMLGFGMPCTLLTWWMPQFVGYGLYAMVFPFCMVLAIISSPSKHSAHRCVPERVHIFRFAQWCNLLVLRCIGPPPAKSTTPRGRSASKGDRSSNVVADKKRH